MRGGTERVEFFRGQDRQWYFRRVSANNEIQAESEGYQNHADAIATAAKLFSDVPWWEQNGQTWREIVMNENGGPEPQTETDGEEVPEEPEFEAEPQEDDVEDGPEPQEDWAEDGAGDEG